jgi:hypothetical protein
VNDLDNLREIAKKLEASSDKIRKLEELLIQCNENRREIINEKDDLD